MPEVGSTISKLKNSKGTKRN